MSVRFFYVDESYDDTKFCLSAIAVRHTEWRDCFNRIKQHRGVLKQKYGIYLRKEIHSTDFVAGRGKISDKFVSKRDRCRVFEGLLNLVASLPNVMVFNICLDKAGRTDPQLDAWDRLLNRIERTLFAMEEKELPLRRGLTTGLTGHVAEGPLKEIDLRLNHYASRGMIFADEGKEISITKTFRKMNVFNPIPSKLGGWSSGESTKNIPIQRVLEDPIFKRSDQSYFVQLADCVAYSLLKKEVPQTPHVAKYGLHLLFDKVISRVCFRNASPSDPNGIVRK
jgi:hypothetical protein